MTGQMTAKLGKKKVKLTLANVSERIDELENVTIYNLQSQVNNQEEMITELTRLYECMSNSISFLSDMVWEQKHKMEVSSDIQQIDTIQTDIKKIKGHIGLK